MADPLAIPTTFILWVSRRGCRPDCLSALPFVAHGQSCKAQTLYASVFGSIRHERGYIWGHIRGWQLADAPNAM